jgi:uncharacterized protein
MILVDANLLLYAYNSSFPRHEAARVWFERALAGSELVGLPWLSVLAFLRISTNPRAFPAPLAIDEASRIVSQWFEHSGVRRVDAGESHWTILNGLLSDSQASGPLVTDAHLAALAIEHGALLCTADRDFRRFDGLRVEYPLG